MRIAVISHSCVIDVNQQIFAELGRRPDVQLLLIAPERWLSSLRGTMFFTPLPGLAQMSCPLPSLFAGHVHFHWYRGLREKLRAFAPDVLYVDEEPYSLVTFQALRVCNELGCRFVFYTKQNLAKRYPPPFSWIQRQVLNSTDLAVAVSAGAVEVLRTWGYRGPVRQLPHGIDPEILCPQDASDLLRRLRIQRPIVGYAGRIEADKGVWDLLGAAELLHQRIGPTFRVMLVGDGPARWKLAAAARRMLPPELFYFTGSVAHHAIGQYLSAMDILVLPSRTQRHWKEQFGRVLVEALACGVPLVGSSSGNIPALIEQTGGGLVFREGDIEDLADKLQQLLENPQEARRMAQHGRTVVLEKFAYPQVAAALHEALKEALAAPPRGQADANVRPADPNGPS